MSNLRRRPVALEVAGFVVGLDPTTTSPFLNYATPLPGARPSASDVAVLIEAFRSRGLTPRLEFAPDAAPDVEPALRRAGFTTEADNQYLACTADTLVVPERPLVDTPVSDDDYASIDAALSAAFGEDLAASPEGAARLRRQQENGGFVRFVRAPNGFDGSSAAGGSMAGGSADGGSAAGGGADGGCAGAGSCSAPAEGTAELAGVGTRPQYRGRGIAAAVTAVLARDALAAGADSVWLEFGGEGSRRVYERVGFRVAGRRLYLAL